jgi:hypothetical protein
MKSPMNHRWMLDGAPVQAVGEKRRTVVRRIMNSVPRTREQLDLAPPILVNKEGYEATGMWREEKGGKALGWGS